MRRKTIQLKKRVFWVVPNTRKGKIPENYFVSFTRYVFNFEKGAYIFSRGYFALNHNQWCASRYLMHDKLPLNSLDAAILLIYPCR